MATFAKALTWFMVGAAAWGGLMRLLLSRRLARIQERGPLAGRLAHLMGPVCLLGALGYGLMLVLSKLSVWPLMFIAFFLLTSADFTVQARRSSLDSRLLQNRLFGILYLGFAASACVLTLRLRF